MSSCQFPMSVSDSSLEAWTAIASGGFGQVFKARHRGWCCDVAVKLLHHDDRNSESALLKEIDMARQGSSPHVVLVRGVFKGRPPGVGSTRLGLVMEFMERGSLASLQHSLNEAPPWPLVCRLAHQVGLGINFLHSLSPALLHMDLKPSNVLLDCSLNAKLTDFGLARLHCSVSCSSKKTSDEEGGTIRYMPPEAFDLLYKPDKASDIYSYGILLWSIVTGKPPYGRAQSSLVQHRIPKGDRPSVPEFMLRADGCAGFAELRRLMERCWDQAPGKRPCALECAIEAEKLHKMHKEDINDVVHAVQRILDKEKDAQRMLKQFEGIHVSPFLGSGRWEPESHVTVPTGRTPIQEMDGSRTADQKDIARVEACLPFSDPPSSRHLGDDVSRRPTDDKVKKSSVCPIRSPPSSPSARRPAGGGTEKAPQQGSKQERPSKCQRQNSSPAPQRVMEIRLSDVVGLQYGDNNSMSIQTVLPRERRRHPTAPPGVNHPSQRRGSRKDTTGGPPPP
ncbi:receptor-interacting serine/threonine-protein kinase 3 isoform X1 [Gasterosteus aculeatus]